MGGGTEGKGEGLKQGECWVMLILASSVGAIGTAGHVCVGVRRKV